MTGGDRPRCAQRCRDAGIDPAGTAPCPSGFLLVEWPAPWPRDVHKIPALTELVGRLKQLEKDGRGHRLQLVCRDETRPGVHHVVGYRRLPGPFKRFFRREARVATADLGYSCDLLLNHSELSDEGLDADNRVRDALVCTHGSRDVCCGSLGTALYRQTLEAAPASVRLWRTSHLGGHRFAPTALTLPDGQCWGFLDGSTLEGILRRSLDADRLVQHYRGSSGLVGDHAVQVVEREAFRREGWAWLDCLRQATVLPEGGAELEQVLLEFVRPSGVQAAYLAKARRVREMRLPRCREFEPVGGTLDVEFELESVIALSGCQRQADWAGPSAVCPG